MQGQLIPHCSAVQRHNEDAKLITVALPFVSLLHLMDSFLLYVPVPFFPLNEELITLYGVFFLEDEVLIAHC